MKNKIKTWIKRYLPAEIVGTLCAFIFPTILSFISQNTLIIALTSNWSETIGFYLTMITLEVLKTRKNHKEQNKKFGSLAITKIARNILLEFGISETADTLFIRPAILYFSLTIFKNIPLGILVGKILADITFYIPTIISYELKQKHLKD